MEILTIPVETLREAIKMRGIRNDCREFMTRDTSKIGLIKQIKWFYTYYLPNKKANQVTAYLGFIDNKAVAYGIIRDEYGKKVISGGVRKKQRKYGIGTAMFKFLTEEASKIGNNMGRRSVFLEVLETNEIAQKIYKRLGFVEKERKDGVIYMQRDLGEFDVPMRTIAV